VGATKDAVELRTLVVVETAVPVPQKQKKYIYKYFLNTQRERERGNERGSAHILLNISRVRTLTLFLQNSARRFTSVALRYVRSNRNIFVYHNRKSFSFLLKTRKLAVI
jgi:hypothetical protein